MVAIWGRGSGTGWAVCDGRGGRETAGCQTSHVEDAAGGNIRGAYRACRPAGEGGGDRRDAGGRRGWGGAAVVLRARESRVHGEGRQCVSQGGKVMSEDAPGNPGAVAWPDEFTASVMVRSMQIKLQRWAGDDSSRRIGDLFNLDYAPAFLVHAWERVSTNRGAQTAGIDKATAAMIETWVGVEAFLRQSRDSLKSGGFG